MRIFFAILLSLCISGLTFTTSHAITAGFGVSQQSSDSGVISVQYRDCHYEGTDLVCTTGLRLRCKVVHQRGVDYSVCRYPNGRLYAWCYPQNNNGRLIAVGCYRGQGF